MISFLKFPDRYGLYYRELGDKGLRRTLKAIT